MVVNLLSVFCENYHFHIPQPSYLFHMVLVELNSMTLKKKKKFIKPISVQKYISSHWPQQLVQGQACAQVRFFSFPHDFFQSYTEYYLLFPWIISSQDAVRPG